MEYVRLGKTGLKVSAVSFGGIPIQRCTADEAAVIVDKLDEVGMNFIDTARGYTVSEEYLGAALKGRRDRFILATKSMVRDCEGMKKEVDVSLDKLQTDYIDLYQIHNIKTNDFDKVFGEDGAYRALEEARQEGKIGHIGITAHSSDDLKRIVESHAHQVESIMFPYNIVEIQGAETLKEARKSDIGVIAMKPLAGGNLEDWRLALRFVALSGVCDVSIPGMGSVEEVERNASVCCDLTPLTDAELEEIERLRKELGNQFCRRCGYCAPCTVGIDIPTSFVFANYLRKYGLADWAKERYAAMGAHASDCIACGVCEERCPYDLPIIDMMAKVAADFGK
ncbi:MAG TPA: aldo/keto reductase [Clostridiales bacterium]|jgi:predicted aldo/keto reductase-like oxidoreductase|nr:aldo/keto reductase [Clostridiales bacterium]